MTGKFVHLHVHSEYSILDGAIRIDQLVDTAKRYNCPAVSLTDHGNMFGAVQFYKTANKKGIKPIIGYEAYVAPGSRQERKKDHKGGAYEHLLLLATNYTGYRNLLQLSSRAYQEGFYYRPRVDKELLEEYHEGLIVLSACLAGEIPQKLLINDVKGAKAAAGWYREVFGKENFYLEIMDNGLPEQNRANLGLMELASQMDIPLVATNDCHYLNRTDKEMHDVLLCLQTGKTLDDPNRFTFPTDHFYFKSPEEMIKAFRHRPEAITNTYEIAQRCNVDIPLDGQLTPYFTLPKDKEWTHQEFLRHLTEKGANKHFGGISEDIQKRIDYELDIIHQKGFDSYFLIVWDFVRFAKDNDISVGPGRGSAAGSLVSYCLGITDLNPLDHGLLFERFLNPERESPPDIDIDFSDRKRDEVIKYVSEKYGGDNVAQIATFAAIKAKNAIRDVGRVLGLPVSECDRISKMIPDGNITIAEAMRQVPELRQASEIDKTHEKLFSLAKAVEGMVRQTSVHAAGIIIGKEDLRKHTPLMITNKNDVCTQYSMKDLGKIGLLKMDFLGLRTLSIIEDTLKILNDKGITLDLKNLPFDDEDTYVLLSEARTNGVFQLESTGMKDILKKLKPTRFNDLSSVLALYRPGPLGSGMVDDFIGGKHGTLKIKYDHPTLKPVLEETYGVILYQEQVMRIVHEMGGFSLGKSDEVRRAMGKKDRDLMQKLEAEFLVGAKERSIPDHVAKKVFELLSHFSGYGFNKSHTAAYAVISYQTAYLKCHHPKEFMAALLTNEMGNTDKLVRYIKDCKNMGITVLPPDVNKSYKDFTVVDEGIRFGFGGIKNVGQAAIPAICKAREKIKSFKTLEEFCENVDLNVVNCKVIECLIRCGAMDSLGAKRAQLLQALPRILERAIVRHRDREAGQDSLFGAIPSSQLPKEPLPQVPELIESERLKDEKRLLGIYVTGHPLSNHEEELKLFSNVVTSELGDKEGRTPGLRIGGVITKVRLRTAKSGDRMAYLTLEDLEGTVDVVIWPDLYKKQGNLLQEDKIVVIEGEGDIRNNRANILASHIHTLEEARSKFIKCIHIRLISAGLEESLLSNLREILLMSPGEAEIVLHIQTAHHGEVLIKPGERYRVSPTPAFIEQIKNLLEEDFVSLEMNAA